ncbi:hypothetical protein C8R47DRAFT_1104075 [Mycena vitilis]|nr:hypothetical protein C8R47DRAFT_1104075 [Mycena vitilis]
MAVTSLKSRSPVEFAIVGGSVAGLTAAYTLRQAGHKVLVLERRAAGTAVDGGLRIPPNMTRLLQTLPGASELLEKFGTQCSGLKFVDHETSEEIGRMEFIDEVMSDLGCHFYLLPHDVLLGYLLGLCKKSGVEIRFQVEVSSIQLHPQGRPVAVTLNGDRIEADVLVGADGHCSVVRDCISQKDNEEDTPSDEYDSDSDSEYDSDSDSDSATSDDQSLELPFTEAVGVTYSIPISRLQSDPELLELASSNEFMVWPGTNFFIEGHRCGPDLYTACIIRTDGIKPTDMDSEWRPNTLEISESDDLVLRSQEPRVERLIRLAKNCHRTIQRIARIPRLSDPATGVVIIGDAAHSMPMHATHNSSLSTEDAFALGRIFAHLTSVDQIPFLLRGYQQVRYRRTVATAASEMASITLTTVPPGPAREERNANFKAMALMADDGVIDEAIAGIWEGYLVQFNYDANEAVDEWWLNWGKLQR